MKKIVVATNNKGKLKEIKNILKEYEILSLEEVEISIEVEENGKSFKENALKKAKEVYKICKIPCIADDSGLCIDIFNGWPGVKTARFLGNSTQEERNSCILHKMIGKENEERKAEVVCDIAYVDNERQFVVQGVMTGKIAKKEKGNNGFGFDSIFELDNGKTLAQLNEKEKNEISSRKIALEKLKNILENK